MMTRRLAAVASLLIGLATVVLAIVVAVAAFPAGLAVLAALAVAVAAAFYGATRRPRQERLAGFGAAAALLIVAVVLIVVQGHVLENILIFVGVWLALAFARTAFAIHVTLPPAARPRRAVLFMNPRSGGGKAERYRLADEARSRGIEPIELEPGDDLRELVEWAVNDGADALAMAGGDGSQAIVAAAAAEHRLPYACIPAGTRNHFALDLGVDREDVVGALDAFVNGGERRVDLARVNGRIFVNNVSLGLYAEAVQRSGYRDAKLRTLLRTVPDVFEEDSGLELRWKGPGGHQHRTGVMILVSNNSYRLGRALGSGTRPRLDAGTLGVTIVERERRRGADETRPWREWSTPAFEVDSARPVSTGIDGEAVMLDPPLRFEILPAALRVRIARSHPGASPSAAEPDGIWSAIRGLVQIAAGHAQTPYEPLRRPHRPDRVRPPKPGGGMT
jgi:diacylglycerol kinase family enzyme